jgi:tetratricopeptide (TPR) repeat protein
MKMVKRLLLMAAVLWVPVFLNGCESGSGQDVRSLLEKAGQGASSSDYDRGKRELAAGDYGLAIEAFAAEVARDPKSIRALNGEAIAYDKLGRSDVAERFFQAALAVDQNSPETLNNLAILHLTHGDPDGAIVLAERAKAALPSKANDKTTAALSVVVNNNEALMRVPVTAPQPNGNTADTAALKIEKVDGDRSALALSTRATPATPVTESGPAPAPVIPITEADLASPVKPVTESNLAQASPVEPVTEANLVTPPAKPVTESNPAPASQVGPVATADLVTPPAKPVTEADPAPAPQAEEVASPSPAAITPREAVAGGTAAVVPLQAAAPSAGVRPRAAVAPLQAAAQSAGAKLRIANGSGRHWMAHRFKWYFATRGLQVGQLVNASSYGQRTSRLYYHNGRRDAAESVAELLPIGVKLVELRKFSSAMDLVVGTDLNKFDIELVARRTRPTKLAQR